MLTPNQAAAPVTIAIFSKRSFYQFLLWLKHHDFDYSSTSMDLSIATFSVLVVATDEI
jgi:hypothetical protein